jgi:hypothetical protein
MFVMDNQTVTVVLDHICDYLAELERQNDKFSLEVNSVEGASQKLNPAFDEAFKKVKYSREKLSGGVLTESAKLQDIRRAIAGLG